MEQPLLKCDAKASSRRGQDRIEKHNDRCELEVDGGIDMHTAPISVEAGANVLVAGTSIFGAVSGPRAAVQEMIKLTSDGSFE